MKIVCTRDNLIKGLSIISGVATKNINLPILNNVLIKAKEQKIVLVATNLEIAISTQLRGKIEIDGDFTVPAKTLTDFVSLLSDETIHLEVKENELEVSCGKSSTKIKGTTAEDFPVLPNINEGNGYLVEAEYLKKALDQVSQSAAKNDIRPELAGVLFNFNSDKPKELILAATDSYRLAETKIKINQGEEQSRVIVPIRSAQEINRVLSIGKDLNDTEKTARLTVSENQIVLRHNNTELISRLTEGVYPDYTQIIPTEFKTIATLNTSNLTKDVKAASLFTTTGVNAITFKITKEKEMIEVSSASAQAGEHHAETNVKIEGEDNSIVLNHRYVIEGLNNIKNEDCVIKIVNQDSPCLIGSNEDGEYTYIVMPIRQ